MKKTALAEIGNFFFWINPSEDKAKITIGLGDGAHLTIRFWKEGYLDIHTKNEKTGEFTSIIKIRYFTIGRLLASNKDKFRYLFQQLIFSSFVNLGKLKHHNLMLFAMSQNEKEVEKYLLLKGNRIKFHKNPDWESFIKFILTPAELVKSNEEVFQVFKLENGGLKRQGFLYKLKQLNSSKRFIFITSKRYSALSRNYLFLISEALKQVEFEFKDRILNLLTNALNDRYRNVRNSKKRN